jgi:REP element-mobilizing transposase RayT
LPRYWFTSFSPPRIVTDFSRKESLRQEVHAYLATIFKEYDSPSLMIGGVEDHVHILCSLSRNHAISEIIRQAKRNSSKWIKTKGRLLAKFSWQNGYGAFSVSQSQVAEVRRYILRQEEHHRRITFQEEFRLFLKRYDVDYDERYVWD